MIIFNKKQQQSNDSISLPSTPATTNTKKKQFSIAKNLNKKRISPNKSNKNFLKSLGFRLKNE